MKSDRFWLIFFLVVISILLLGLSVWWGHGALVKPPTANVVDVFVEPGHDPFERPLRTFEPENPYVYRESLAHGFSASAWSAVVNWRSTNRAYEGTRAGEISYTAEWGGVYIETPAVPANVYDSLRFAIHASPGIPELYIESYNAAGDVTGRQPIGWYTPHQQLVPGRWQVVRVPLANLGVEGKPYGLAIISPVPGTVFLDDMTFATDTVVRSVAPEITEPTPTTTATTTPTPEI